MGRLGLQRWVAELEKYGWLGLERLVAKLKEKIDRVGERFRDSLVRQKERKKILSGRISKD
jgi:hypothetical protein